MFFRVSWYYKDKVRYFFFRVLPYGLSLAPYIFTKIFRPFLVTNLMTKSLKMAIVLGTGWDVNLSLPPSIRDELTFWKDNIRLMNGTLIGQRQVSTSFYSRYWSAGCEGANTSCYDWVWENNWLVLLVTLIPRLSGILRIIKLRVLLSYPNWAPSRSGPCSSCSSLLTIPLSGASLLLLTLQEFLSGASLSPFSTHPSLMH